ncbi:MAG: DUF11 domain-containing protein [Sedimentisphaerales bacterium]|jgi:uncharacterized repeat protein (TIGR01451 family)|nr:DUF11 domain-containing protein [Sedimentisphaerales bacterium]
MRRLLNISVLLLVLAFWGCQSHNMQDNVWGIKPAEPSTVEQPVENVGLKPVVETLPGISPVAVERPAEVKPNLVAVNESVAYIVSMTYPSVDYGIIRVDKVMPREVGLKDPFDYTIKVTNLTDVTLSGIVITEELPTDFEFINASPAPKREANKLIWTMDALGPKSSRQITITGKGTSSNQLDHGTTITQAMQVHTNVQIVQSKLALTMTMPTELLLCEPIPVEFVLTNSGTGIAQNLKIIDTLPAGLQTADGKSELILDVGALAAGQSQKFSTQLRATKTGVYINKAAVNSATNLVVESLPAVITIRQPKLAVSKTGPQRQYLGRALAYEITIANNGDGVAKDTVVEEIIPAGVTSIEATSGAKLSGSKLVWQLGALEPNASRKMRVSYIPTSVGTVTNSATVTAYCAETVTASLNTSVTGMPAVHLEVNDLEDPIEVGSPTTYVITLTNQGSAPDTNIRIICTLEDKMQYVTSAGATSGSLMGNTISLAPLPSLAPSAKATWRVIVKGIKPGDVRFKVTMSSDQLVRLVEETEATHIYE